jgi:hypothetical protein
VPTFRVPRVKRAQNTEVALGGLLTVMLIGLAILIKKFHIVPDPGKTVPAQLTDAALGHNASFFAVQIITMILLALAANTSFGGMPVLGGLLAHDIRASSSSSSASASSTSSSSVARTVQRAQPKSMTPSVSDQVVGWVAGGSASVSCLPARWVSCGLIRPVCLPSCAR